MIYLVYLLLVPCSLLLTLLAVILAPVLPIFAKPLMGWCDNHSYEAVEPRLPIWLNWFMTPDNSLNGDATFAQLHAPSYWSQVLWLWRNPAYSFGLRYLAVPYTTDVKGDKTIKDNQHAKEGCAWFILMDSFSSFALSGFFLALGVFTLIWAGILGVWWMIMSCLNLLHGKLLSCFLQE